MDNSIQHDALMDHNYDGIQEYDNPTPGWWWWIFHATTVFSVGYIVFFHLGKAGWTAHEAYDSAVAANLTQQFGEIGDLKPDEATILRFIDDERWLAVGKVTFQGKCVSCHGANAEGLTGPNMTDDHYKNVKKLIDIAMVIMNGAANGAMPGWRNQLHPNEVVLTAAYIASLRGQNLPGPRGPEGEIAPPWPAAAAPASGDSAAPSGETKPSAATPH